MKKTVGILVALSLFICITGADGTDCEGRPYNTSAMNEQAHIEKNQQSLNQSQPSPTITWSLERDNLIKRFKLMNDRSISFFMYLFIEGIADPIGYYQINKISSVDSQLTATEQIVYGNNGEPLTIESPAEDGSYGTNGNGVFGFTPEDIYLETNLKYVCSSVPLTFTRPVNRLAIINSAEARMLLDNSKEAMR